MRKYTREQWLDVRNKLKKNIIFIGGLCKFYPDDNKMLELFGILDDEVIDKFEEVLYSDHLRESDREPEWIRMFYRDYTIDDEYRNYVREGQLQESETVPILKDVYNMVDAILVTFNKYNELLTETKDLTNTLIERYG